MKKILKTIIASALVAAMMIGTSLTACAAPAAGETPTQVTPNGVLVYGYYAENIINPQAEPYPAEYLLAIDAAGITNEMSEYEKCVRINNYLCAVAEYGTPDPRYMTQIPNMAYKNEVIMGGCSGLSIFRYGKAVCEGYSDAFTTMTGMLGINGQMMCSRILNHKWNIVTIDGVNYYVDTTWNDTSESNDYLMSTALWADHAAADIEFENSAVITTTNNDCIYSDILWSDDPTVRAQLIAQLFQ